MSIKLDFENNDRTSNSESNDEDEINDLTLLDINECKSYIENIFLKYNNNQYIKSKIKNYILNSLQNNINSLITSNEKKSLEKERKQNNINDFIGKFLINHKYFYNSSSDIFFYYDDKNYNTIKEDTIIANINNYINKLYKINNEKKFDNNNNILEKKYTYQNINEIYEMREKVKTIIFKKIKETSINTYIPESSTIQNIFSLLIPTFFSEKNMAKYFLVCIGDIILKKNNSTLLINSECKNLIKLLSSYSYTFFGTSYFSDFKYKYHEQQKSCKIIKINSFKSENFGGEFHKNILNLLCVAIHYSIRFTNSENFLNEEGDNNLINYVNLLNHNNFIVNNFIENYLEYNSNSGNIISSKNMHYLWKDYLNYFEIPKIAFSNNFKLLLREKINYNETSDLYYNIISKNLPIVSGFITFWDNYFKIIKDYDIANNDIIDNNYYKSYYESSEILNLYKKYLISKCNLKSEKIILILKHYYENLIIIDKKIYNITCDLWNKEKDITEFLEFFKNKLQISKEEYPQSLVFVYSEYVNYARKLQCTINKDYFMSYIKFTYRNFIDDEILLTSWWN